MFFFFPPPSSPPHLHSPFLKNARSEERFLPMKTTMVARGRGCSPLEGGLCRCLLCRGGPSAPSPRPHPRRRSQREDARPAERLRRGRGWSRGALRGGRRGQPQLLPPRSSVPEEESRRAGPLLWPSRPPPARSLWGRILPGPWAEPHGAPEAVFIWGCPHGPPGRSGPTNQYAGFGTSVASWEELGGFFSLPLGLPSSWDGAAARSWGRGQWVPPSEPPKRCRTPPHVQQPWCRRSRCSRDSSASPEGS